MVTVKCENCGKKFEKYPSHLSDKNFCSKECQEEYWKEKGKVECDYCGETFHKPPSHIERNEHHFCSEECKRKWQGWDKRIEKECEECGKKFEVIPGNKDARFCSQGCQNKWMSENLSEENSPHWKEEGDVKCDWCGKEFHKKVAEIKEHNFCSKECANKWKKENYSEMGIGEHAPDMKGEDNPNWKETVEVECKECGKKFKVTPARENIAKFCSRFCMAKWKSEHSETAVENLPDPGEMRGEKHPRWKGGREPYYGPNWHQKRKETLERDNYTCQKCGKSEEDMDREPSVHHIKPLRKFKDEDGNINFEEANKPSNLITLCPTCHQKIERWPVQIEYRD